MNKKIKIPDFLSKIKEKLISLNSWKNIKISSKEKIIFLEQLSNLLNSWIPIINSFKIMSYQTRDKRIKKIINIFLNKINKWLSIKEIAAWFPKIFNQFDLSIIEMWEVTWKLWESIDLIKDKEEKTKELKWKILWALVYPIVIVSLSIAMIIVFMVYVIPKVKKMYKDAKVNLPELTQTVIDISKFMQDNVIYIILWIIAFVIAIIIFKTNKKTKIYWDQFIIKIPIFWPLIKKKILAMYAWNLWILLQRWIIINQALEISSQTLENDFYQKEIKKIISWISSWKELSDMMWINQITSWKENPYFPIELSSIVKIWEQTWKLPDLLIKISEKYKKEINNIVKNLATAIEPLVIVVVWIIVWILIMAIMLPFFNMVNVI